MKKLFFISACALLLLCASSAFAMDYVLGARGGFFFWRPFYKDTPSGTGFDDMRTGHGGLYGPVVVLNFTEEVSFSVSGLFGQQVTQWHTWNRTGFTSKGEEYQYSSTSYVEANRYDVDSALSYAILPGLRLFLGYKFQYMKVEWYTTQRSFELTPPKTQIDDLNFEFKTPLHGVALGCGYSRPLTELYFFSVSASGIYTRGRFDSIQYKVKYDENGFVTGGVEPNPRRETFGTDMQQYGLNIEPAVGIRTSGPVVSIGIRYQLLRTQFHELGSSGGDGPDNRWMNDHLYGIFMTVMFSL